MAATDPPPNPDDHVPEPRKLTEDLILAFAMIVGRGQFRAVAAQKLGINPSTVWRWMAMGKRFPLGTYGLFRACVLEAEADAEMSLVDKVLAAGDGDPKLWCWYLERKHPQRYGRWRGELHELRTRLRELEREVAEREAAYRSPDPSA